MIPGLSILFWGQHFLWVQEQKITEAVLFQVILPPPWQSVARVKCHPPLHSFFLFLILEKPNMEPIAKSRKHWQNGADFQVWRLLEESRTWAKLCTFFVVTGTNDGPNHHFRGTFAHLSFDPLAICLYNDVMCKPRVTLDFHGIWVQLRCNFTQCAQSRLQFKRVCTCNWKHYCHIDAIKIRYDIHESRFRILCSSSSHCVLLLVVMVFLLVRNRQFWCQPFFFLSKKPRRWTPSKPFQAFMMKRLRRLLLGGVRHWGDAIFLGGKTTPVYVVWVIFFRQGWCTVIFLLNEELTKTPGSLKKSQGSKITGLLKVKGPLRSSFSRPVAAEGWDFWRLFFFV